MDRGLFARIRRLFELSILLLLAWGALAFGAEYAWAYAPLLVFSLVPSVLGLRQSRGALPSKWLMLTFAVVLLGGVLQVVLPARIVPTSWQAPPHVEFARLYAVVLMEPMPATSPASISILPARTVLGLTFLAAFGLLFAGCTRAISALGPRRVTRGIVVLGVIVAFVGIIQASVQSETVYGLWRGPSVATPFAPFLNKNHFAGWMAMVLSLAMGVFGGQVAVAFERVRPDWRSRLVWFSSQSASRMVLNGLAVAVMALSIVMAVSRGGLVGLALSALIGLAAMLRRQSRRRRVVGTVALASMVLLALSWGGVDRTLDRFEGAWQTWGGRQGIWSDTLRVIRHYPITGTGYNTFGIAMLHYQHDYEVASAAVIEAHNDYLQLAAEGGLLLGVPALVALGLFVGQIRRRFTERRDDVETYWLRVGAVTGLAAIAVMEAFDFTLQIPGAAVMCVVLAAIAIHRPNFLAHEPAESGPRGRS